MVGMEAVIVVVVMKVIITGIRMGMVVVIIDIMKAADGASGNENNYHFLFCVPQGFSQISWWSLGSLSSALYTSQCLLQEVFADQALYTSSSSSSAVRTPLSTSPPHVSPVHVISHIDLWTC